jgi:hypothetical protein
VIFGLLVLAGITNLLGTSGAGIWQIRVIQAFTISGRLIELLVRHLPSVTQLVRRIEQSRTPKIDF